MLESWNGQLAFPRADREPSGFCWLKQSSGFPAVGVEMSSKLGTQLELSERQPPSLMFHTQSSSRQGFRRLFTLSA